MKISFKVLTITLVCTVVTQSFKANPVQEKEWTAQEMQAKLDELKTVEEAAQEDKALYAHTIYAEGTYTVNDLQSKVQLQLLKENAQLIAECMSREGTFRTEQEEINDAPKRKKCADCYLAFARKSYNPESGYSFRELLGAAMGSAIMNGALPTHPTRPIQKPVEGDKLVVSLFFDSKTAEDGTEVLAFKCNVTGHEYRRKIIERANSADAQLQANLNPVMHRIQQAMLGACTGADREVFKFDLNTPIALSPALTIHRVGIATALKQAQEAAKKDATQK